MTDLHNLRPAKGSHRVSKRLGQGPGSGTGKTAGKGHKGSKARTGHHGPGGGKAGFEGGQMPLYRRIPKRGFTPLARNEFQVVNLYQIAALAETDITADVLKAHGLISKLTVPVKVLGVGELAAAKTVSVSAFSKSAREKIEAAGGRAQAI